MNPDLGRRLIELERSLGAAEGSGAAPAMLTLLAFDGERDEAAAFANALRGHFAEVCPYVEVLDLAGPRPAGLKPAWAFPRQWIDYVPSPAELADLRPDLRPPTTLRNDWSPPMPSKIPENAPAAAQDASSAASPTPEAPGGKNGLLGASSLAVRATALADAMTPRSDEPKTSDADKETPDALD